MPLNSNNNDFTTESKAMFSIFKRFMYGVIAALVLFVGGSITYFVNINERTHHHHEFEISENKFEISENKKMLTAMQASLPNKSDFKELQNELNKANASIKELRTDIEWLKRNLK